MVLFGTALADNRLELAWFGKRVVAALVALEYIVDCMLAYRFVDKLL